MAIKKELFGTPFLGDTRVENIFIQEFMGNAPGDYVKVYLCGLMAAELGTEADHARIAGVCCMEEEDVLKAWTFWEERGVIRKRFRSHEDRLHYDVLLCNLRETMYGSRQSEEAEFCNQLEDPQLQALYRDIEKLLGKPLGSKEYTEIASWMGLYGAAPELICTAYGYCVNIRGKRNVEYVASVIRGWTEQGIRTEAAAREYLEENDRRHGQYKRIFRALGFTRNATEREQELIDSWFDRMGFSMSDVLDACGKTSGITNPSINYVNAVLERRHGGSAEAVSADKQKGVSAGTVRRYYEYIRRQAEEAAAGRIAEVYEKLPEIKEIDGAQRDAGFALTQAMLTGDRAKTEALKAKIHTIGDKREALLVKGGFPAAYMETRYRCPLCGDTGISESGERCSCYEGVSGEALEWQKK